MLTEIKDLVSKIQQSETELEIMKRENILLGSEKMKEVFEVAKKGLEFENIFKIAMRYGTPIEEREYFYRSDGEFLKGVLLYSFLEYSEKTGEEEIQEFKEVFLLEDGSLKVFYTTHRWKADQKFSIQHVVTRIELEFDQSEFYFGNVIKCILKLLKKRHQDLEWRKYLMTERLENLKSLQDSLMR